MKTLQTIFSKSFSPEFIVFFRIAIGIIVLIHFLSFWSDFDLLYTNHSIIPLELHTAYNTFDILTIEKILGFLNSYFTENQSILIFKYTYVILCILIISGFFSRISALFLLILQVSFVKSGSLFFYGADFFTSMSLFYIILFPSSSFFSLQQRLFPKLSRNFQSLTLCKRLIQIHVCIAYFFSGLDKILGFNWWNGESIWKAIHLPNLYKFVALGDYIQNPVFYIIFGWGTIIIELFYPLFINLNKTRKYWLILTISMHVGIIIFFNLFFFSAIMIVWNLTSYYFNYYNETKTVAAHSPSVSGI
ncbi:HTTM domain-containing protein [Chryseobacterium sp. SIMBA_029]|uniref:HTTM domain-containing protein n=1 Tax=Chryseobacterium sp. SIMBA_029 TaxID=3085772 RepID=UPI00397D047A